MEVVRNGSQNKTEEWYKQIVCENDTELTASDMYNNGCKAVLCIQASDVRICFSYRRGRYVPVVKCPQCKKIVVVYGLPKPLLKKLGCQPCIRDA